MVLTLILLLVAASAAVATYYFGGYMSSLQWIWLPFVLTYAFFWAAFLLHAIIVAFIGAIYKRSNREYPPTKWAQWILAQTCFVTCLFFRIRIHASGLGKFPSRKKAVMVVSNHLSGFDHLVLVYLLSRRNLVCVSKVQNFDIILAGGWMKRSGYLAIAQNDILSGTKIIEKAGQYLKQGVSVCIAPEGTRNKSFPEPWLLPFHPGSFQMAYDSGAPIAVFAIQNTNGILRRFPLRHTDVYFDCVGYITEEEYRPLAPKELATKCEKLILRRFEQKEARFYHLPKKEAAPTEEK